MKTIIAGGRDVKCAVLKVDKAVKESGFIITEVVSGGAQGVDLAGEEYADYHSLPIKRFPADWRNHGMAAGPIRNKEMAKYAEALVAVWDGKSKGTKNMIETAKKLGLKVFVYAI